MNRIDNVDELLEELVTGRWHPKSANPLASSNYPGLSYSCGCGSDHMLSFTDFIMVGNPVKFVFFCDNDYLTGIRVKGIFKQKSYELWTCKKSLYLEAIEAFGSD
jgi:hypothetical protein|tara:strand:+ start:369 stop:683 length:315 start_codon:yes stop_codon:yes gene_type:complete